jgi:drug/metabolite transporter (DMT)-like permease
LILRPRARLALLVLVWAISWPAVKAGVGEVPPLWYAFLRYAIASCCMFALAGWRGELAAPSRTDWRLVWVSGVLQMAAYAALTATALTTLPPGRASVLAYSTPLWVAPISAWRSRERLSASDILGVVLGTVGVAIIAAPAIARAQYAQLHGCALLLAAAAAWAIAIVYVRGHRFDASILTLAPWQMLIAAVLLLPLAIAFEGRLPRVGGGATASLAYVGPVATAFAYWAMVDAGRHFRPNTIAMALLAVPCLGVLISVLLLAEPMDPWLAIGALSIGIGMRFALAREQPRHAQRHEAEPSFGHE